MISYGKIRNTLVIFILGLLLCNVFSTYISAQDTALIDITLHIPNGEIQNQYGKSMWIRGIWHYLNFSLDRKLNLVTILFYYSEIPSIPVKKNETNYYQWRFDNGAFEDNQYTNDFINKENCLQDEAFYSFYIGVDQSAAVGNWTLILSTDEQQILTQSIYVDNAVSSLSLKTIPVNIHAEPFTADIYYPEEDFTVENWGNVPLQLMVDFGGYADIFSTIHTDEILKQGQSKRLRILLNSKSSWPPSIRTITSDEMSVIGEVQHVIPPKNIVNLIESNVSIGLPIIIYVARSGYQLDSLPPNIIFQYIERVDLYYNEIQDIYVYISGEGVITVDIDSENLDVLKIISGTVEVQTPFIVNSIETAEHPIIVRVKGIMPNSTAYLHYNLEIDGDIQEFTTIVNIGSFQPREEIPIDTLLITVFFVIIVIIYILYTQMKHMKR